MALRFSELAKIRIVKRDDIQPPREKSPRQKALDRRSIIVKELKQLNRELKGVQQHG